MELIQYTDDQLFDIIVETIKHGKKKYHKYYDKTVERARFCNQIMTGDDQQELLIKFKRENEQQEKQRVKITNSRTQYASSKICSVYNEVSRSDNVVEVIKYKDEGDSNQKKLDEIHERLQKFHGETKAINYVYESLKRLNFYDPNAFIITNFTAFDPRKTKTEFVYPIEVYSQQAIRYQYSNGNLIYLLFYQDIEIDDLDGDGKPITKQAKHYFLFAKDVSFEFIELPERLETTLKPGFQQIDIEILYPDSTNTKDKIKSLKSFQWIKHQTKSKRIPVIRAGYIYDASTRNAICVSPLHAAEKLFLDLIWTKSEYDLAKALHWFYQKFIYAPKCTYENPEDSQDYCNRGTMSVTGEACHVCDGTGMMVHTTIQDVIILSMPDNVEQAIPLANMVHYENIDISIGKHLQEDFKGIEQDIFKAVFNSQAFDRSEVAITATEKNMDQRAVKNALIDFADHCSRVYKFIIQMTAIYLDNDQDLIIQHQHPRDFKFESIEDLVLQREKAVQAGAPYMIIRNIDLAILELQNQDNPEIIELLRARERFRPFREKTEAERMFILSTLKDEDYHRILWVHFEDIMTEIAFEDKTRGEGKEWYRLPYPDQKAIVDEKVKAIQDEVKEQKKEAAKLNPFMRALPGQESEEEEEDADEDQEQDAAA